MSESHFAKQTRLGIEGRIKDAYRANDMNNVNYHLDLYPTGRKRPELTDQQMVELGYRSFQRAIRKRTDKDLNDTQEIPIITPDMRDAA